MKVTREELVAQGCTEKMNRAGTTYFEDTTGEIVAKICSKCSDFIWISGFRKQNGRLGGRRYVCKSCDSESDRKRYEDNIGNIRERVKKYREDNPEQSRESSRRYREANSEKDRERKRKWRVDNPEKLREIRRNWSIANPKRIALKSQRRRARKALLPDTLTIEQQSDIIKHFNGGCALTGSTEYHMDHAIPLTVGYGGTTYENIIPLRVDLNYSKNASHIFEWFEANHERFSMEQEKFDVLISYLAEVNGMNVREYRAYVDYCFDNPRSLDDLTTEEEAI